MIEDYGPFETFFNKLKKEIEVFKEEIEVLKRELHQQKFNNKNNLSIDQKVADEMEKLKREAEQLKWRANYFERTSILENALINKLKKALEFYANPDNYCDNDMLGIPSHMVNGSDDEMISQAQEDGYQYDWLCGGKLAREALKEIK